MTVGNGHKTKFWHNSWLQGVAPRTLSPTLYNLEKHNNKKKLAKSFKIMHGSILQGRINDATQLEEFISIWIWIQEVHLQPDTEDSIS